MKKLLLLFMLATLMSLTSTAQSQQVFVECTAGEFSGEISWEIVTCNGGILLEGGAPFLGAVMLPTYYQIVMHDNYGDGWNGAYLYIDQAEFGFLSDVDWIDSLGTWPQNHTDTLIDVGCLTIGLEEVVDVDFAPTTYFDVLGREVIPNKTGVYIASDGVIRKKVYIIKE